MAKYFATEQLSSGIVTNTISDREPLNGKFFTLEELQEAVDGYIEFVYLQNNQILVVNDSGLINGLTINLPASMEAGQHIFGNAMMINDSELESDDDEDEDDDYDDDPDYDEGDDLMIEDVDICSDCLMYYYNDDLSGLDCYFDNEEADQRVKDIKKGVHDMLNVEGFEFVGMDSDEGDPSLTDCTCCGIRANCNQYRITYKAV